VAEKCARGESRLTGCNFLQINGLNESIAVEQPVSPDWFATVSGA
jgi:hypothetical protein